ncbi:MAG: rhomboid family intramembrane serine protease, partial [Actinomycetota bacterium]|nr:rhomboid family intramembrane serine protease [Actinomycetota bacterium]
VSQPDLFVVCKTCGSEVSPYVTECPYCGQRVRKRAPKLDRPGAPEEEKPRRRRSTTNLPRLRPDEFEGIASDRRPYGTMALIVASLVLVVVYASGVEPVDLGAIKPEANEEPWRFFTAPFVFADKLAYAFGTLLAVGIFGSLLERRFGLAAPVLVFVLAGAAGAALATVIGGDLVLAPPPGFVFGANGAALGLLVAWLVDDRLAARRGAARETDLLGVGVLAAVLVLLSLPVEEANLAAALGGAGGGALLGLLLRPFARR